MTGLTENNNVPAGGGDSASEGWLNGNIVGMSLTSFLSDTGHEMATAVLVSLLALIGSPVYAIGFIEDVADALASFTKLGAGR